MKTNDRRGSESSTTVLIVDDEADIRELLELSIIRMGFAVASVDSVRAAQAMIDSRDFQLCLTDMRLPDGDGLEIVRYIASKGLDLPVAVITAHGSTQNAVAALKSGAFDYLSKPLSLDQLRTLVKSALALPDRSLDSDAGELRLLGSSQPIEHARAMILKLSRSQAPIYVTGESGSGKELAARLVHMHGARRDKPFVPVNCGAIPENLMESEFFGYRKGAFTGAESDRDGFFHAAHGGTLFLDEVADLPLQMQVKLLRAIQEKRIRKIGATVEDPVDVRIICATHQKLSALVETGKFRQDLYYRLNVIELRMPSIRECREDVPELAKAMLARLSRGPAPARLSAEAMDALCAYEFPGNARELENILERALALSSSDEIGVGDLQLTPPTSMTAASAGAGESPRWPLQDYLDRVEKEAILEALDKTRFNRTAAARLLGITFRALRYRMERLGIQ
ncbi:MAG: sigma-54-dependent transcriptional regulator [Burkholderiales bacterium]